MRSADDENFEEAISSVLRSCQTTTVPSAIKGLFNDPKCENLSAEVCRFPWREVMSEDCHGQDMLKCLLFLFFHTISRATFGFFCVL